MESPLPPNPYKILNVAKDATLATIRSAHRKLVLTCHPDKFPDEKDKQQKSEQFHQVQQAYEILSDDTKRQEYDERAKLAELRAEVFMEKGGSRAAPEFSSRPRPSPVYEMRGDRIYEERVPRRSQEDDVFSAKFQEYRPSSKKFDDHYPMPSRRSSGRVSDERRKPREPDEDRDWERHDRQAQKEAERKANHGNKKKSDKDKRRGREAKFSSKSAYVEEDTDSDSAERFYSAKHDAVPKRRRDDIRRRDQDIPRRSSRRDDSDTMRDDDYKATSAREYNEQATSARDYIENSKRGVSIEIGPRRPAIPGIRHVSTFDTRQPLSSMPTIYPADTVRRPSGRTRDSRKDSPVRLSDKNRRLTEIVEPPADRRPAFLNGLSDPRGLKNLTNPSKKEPLRASTEKKPIVETRHPSIRRAETMPLEPSSSRRPENTSSKSSRFKPTETNDSGYSSSGTPELYQGNSPQFKTTTYKINGYDDDLRQPLYREPESYHERDRDVSPRSRRQEDRPTMATRVSSSTRGLPRSNSYVLHSESIQSPRQPPLPHIDSNRGPPLPGRQSSRSSSQLWGEISPPDEYKVVHQSRKIRPEEIRYTTGRDSYTTSSFEPRHHPHLSRNESRATAY